MRGAHLPEDLQLSPQERLVLEALPGYLPVHKKKHEEGKELVDGAQIREGKQATSTVTFMKNSCIS